MSGLKITPHLAVVHKDQGGSANNRHVALLLKSQENLSDESKALLKSVLSPEIEPEQKEVIKASYVGMRKTLEDALEEAADKSWYWVYVYDFDDSGVVYSEEGEIYYRTYTMEGDKVSFGSPEVVTQQLTYEDSSGNIVLSESNKGKGASLLLAKATAVMNSDKSLLETINKKLGDKMSQENQVELTKALEDLNKAKEDLTKALNEVEVLKAQVGEFENQKVELEKARRSEAVAAVQSDEAAAATLLKSLEALDAESFDNVIKAMQAKDETLEKTDLFKQSSVPTGETGEDALEQLMKSRYATDK